MSPAEQQTINKIISYVLKHNPVYSDWYFGIASDAEKRLYIDHKVDKANGIWVYEQMESEQSARNVVEYFINVKKTKGGISGLTENSTFVYGYLITRNTKENV